jgi:hypothetical protein
MTDGQEISCKRGFVTMVIAGVGAMIESAVEK